METPGEHLVGQYLHKILKCDFVEYNLQTTLEQGEIDVVGINSSKNQVIICEVATHLETGLMYEKNGQPDNVNRFVKKFKRNINFARKNFSDYEILYMLWTPIIRVPKRINVKHNQLKDIQRIGQIIKKEKGVDIEMIYNEKYYDCIKKLRQIAKNTTSAMKSPIMRFLQIEEKLKTKNLRVKN